MAGNTFGKIFSLTTFGESHGPAIGGVVDGCPAGLKLDLSMIRRQMSRRRPGQSEVTTTRNEKDEFEILSGIHEGATTGTPIGFIIRNTDQKTSDYDELKNVFRPSHADFTYVAKYGIRDHRGGGRSSARETASRVFAGAIAQQLLSGAGIRIRAFVSGIGPVKTNKDYTQLDLEKTDDTIVRCPDPDCAQSMVSYIEELKRVGDSSGGIIQCVISDLPAGLGEPVFDKLHADLGKAMLSINAVHGFEYGSGFKSASMKGSEHNDEFENSEGKIITSTNHSGGIQGGISNGMDIYFNVAFKPVATIRQDQNTVTVKGEATGLKATGRHDPCVVPRAVPIVESMAALVIADHFLRNRLSKINHS